SGATPIGSSYDFQPSLLQHDVSGAPTGAAGLTAGGNISVTAHHTGSADPVIHVAGTVDLTGTGHLDTTTNGNINYGQSDAGGVLRAHALQSTAGSVTLTVPHQSGGGQNLYLVTGGSIHAATTVLLQAGDDL